MPLSTTLYGALLAHPCPHCGLKHRQTGWWFRSRTSYRCEGCGETVPMGYDDKLRLFARHASPIPIAVETIPRQR